MAEPLRMDYVSNDAEVIAAFKRQQAEMEKERKARVELQKQINDNAAAQKAADKSATETAKAFAAEQAKLASAAAKIAESVRTPLQAYKVGLTELVDHYKSGRLSQEEYLAAGDKLKEQYRDQAGVTAKLEKAEKDKNEEIKSAQRIIEANLTAQQKYERNIAQITDLHKKGRLSLEQYNAAVKAEKTSLDKSAESGDKFGGVLGGLGTKVAGAATGFATMGTVITFIKAEYDALLERQGKSKDANINLAAEQEMLINNLGGASGADVAKQISELSVESNIKEANVTKAVNEAMAARGDSSVGDVVKAVGSAAKISKFAPEQLSGLAAATLDTQHQTGLGTDESLGFLLQMQGQSRTKGLKELAQNVTPAVGGVMKLGADRQTAGAVLASLSHGMGDSTGAMAGTSGIQLAKQLREFSGGQDMGKAIAALQQDPEQRKKFLAGASFEAKALPAVEGLLSGRGQVAKDYAASRVKLAGNPLDALQQSIDERKSFGTIGVAELDQAMGNKSDQIKINDKQGAVSSIVRDRLKELRDTMGKTSISTNMDTVINDFSTGGIQTEASALKSLEGLKSGLKPAKQRIYDQMNRDDTYDGNNPADRERFNATFKERFGKTAEGKQEELLKALIDEIKGMRTEQQDKKLVGAAVGRAKNQNEGGL
jgi:hypothetical protein